MFVQKDNVNILTALLVKHGVTHAVVCPGSRNAPIVHNLNACGTVRCLPVTDERSAGFFALGLTQATRRLVVVCVTSGSALLNVAPAVAEAFYQHAPLIVVSADRPGAWIGQLDGQTLPQCDVFGSLVKKSVSLPVSVDDETERWYCNRLVNEALLAADFPSKGPVHINVPIAEPLFLFTKENLPEERVISCMRSDAVEMGRWVVRKIKEASRPMVVVGQYWCDDTRCDQATCEKAVTYLQQHGVWLSERLTDLSDHTWHVDETIAAVGDDDAFLPDLIVYMGGAVVSKRLKAFLRRATKAEVLMVAPDGGVSDVTTHLTQVVVAHVEDVLIAAAEAAENEDMPEVSAFQERWLKTLGCVARCADDYQPAFSQMAVVRYLEQQLEDMEYDYSVHYANSSAIRLANIYSCHPVWCNRGVNGIDGSLSTAVGFAAAKRNDNVGFETNDGGSKGEKMVVCVTGDLSFFYDQNALWNQNIGGNLRVVLLNNGGGGIFNTLPGLEESEALQQFVSAAHHTTAQGICTQNDIGYLKASSMDEMRMGVVRLLTKTSGRPIVLEVFTDAGADADAMHDYYTFVQKAVANR